MIKAAIKATSASGKAFFREACFKCCLDSSNACIHSLNKSPLGDAVVDS